MQTLALRHSVALFVFLGIFWTQASFAIDGETTVVVPPGTTSFYITYGGSTLDSYEPPEHGNLVPVNRGFDYEPSDSFWAIGHDIVLMEVTHRSGVTATYRYILAAGSLAKADNAVYATTPQEPGIIWQPWVAQAPIVPGTVNPDAYLLDVDPTDPQPSMLSTEPPNTSGHQQTSEHVVNVTVDDLDFNYFPMIQPDNEITFYRLKQGQTTILELRAHFDFAKLRWQIKPFSSSGTAMSYVDVTPGFYQTKLVRWGTPGDSGADFFINGQLMGTITNLPFLLVAPITHELALDQSPEHAGLVMHFEDPVLVTGTAHSDPATRLASDSFDAGSSGTPAVSTDWDVVEGAAYMSFSPQTLAGTGDQLDIDMGAVPHWEHSYVRQEFLSDPLTNYKARFWMDTSQLNIPEGHVMRMIYACRDSETDWCVDFRLFLTRTNGQLEIGLDVWEDGGVIHTLTAPISAGAQVVELQYETSPSTAVATGWVELWVGGVSVGTVRGLDNHNFTIEDMRFGTLYTSSTITGTFSLDELLTWTR